jgi:hypothetical protein
LIQSFDENGESEQELGDREYGDTGNSELISGSLRAKHLRLMIEVANASAKF